MIRTNAKVTRHMQAALNLTMWVATIVLLVLGIGMCLGYLIWAKFVTELPEASFVLLLGVFPLLIGLGLLAIVSKNLSQAKRSKIDNYYAFGETQVLIRTVTDGKEGTAYTYPYAHFKKVTQTKNFLFLYPQNGAAFGVDKRKLSEQERHTLLEWLKNYLTKF